MKVYIKKPFMIPALAGALSMMLTDPATAQTFTTLYNFAVSSGVFPTNGDGMNPNGGLILAGNTLYGTTSQGGKEGFGTAFRINTDGMDFTNLHNFNIGGSAPAAGLTLSGCALFGTAYQGGEFGYGTIFAVNTDGSGFTNLYSFTNGSDGAYPIAELILAGNSLYGTASDDGSEGYEGGYGALFSMNTNGTGFKILHTFSPTSTGLVAGTNSDGALPGRLILAGNTL